MAEEKNTQEPGEIQTVCTDETKTEKYLRWFGNLTAYISYFFTFRNYYYIEVMQALKKVESEFRILKTLSSPEGNGNKTKRINDTDEERPKIEGTVETLICKAQKEKNYSKLWPLVHQIELLLVKLYNENMLIAYVGIVKNNLFVLDEKDQKLWESKLKEYEDLFSLVVQNNNQNNSGVNIPNANSEPGEEPEPEEDIAEDDVQKDVDNRIEQLRALLYTITAEINETRRVEYMTNDLKRVLLRRVMWCTVLCGFLAWIFAYSLIRDPLVNYAILLGLLGGFFSRLYSTKDLNFKPPAFSLLAQYTYVQPLIGAIGAVIMYFILLSPLGTELINDSMYLDAKQTNNYIVEKYTADKKNLFWLDNFLPPFKVNTFISVKDSLIKDTCNKKQNDTTKPKPETPKKTKNKIAAATPPKADSIKIDTIKVVSNHLITKYPKPLLLLILSFLAGFSEKFFMGTVNKIIGSKFISSESTDKKTEQTDVVQQKTEKKDGATVTKTTTKSTTVS
jgi:hypothetical protein